MMNWLCLVIVLRLVAASSLESSLLLSPRQSRSGRSLDIVFSAPHEALCVSSASLRAEALFAQHVCTTAGFRTFSELRFVHVTNVNVEPAQAVAVRCQQSRSSYEISCELSSQETACQYVIAVTCSSCHHQLPVSPGSSLSVASPLYPVLQPDLICVYELVSQSDVPLHFTVTVTDLSLPYPHYSQGHLGQCLQSFVQIESGNSHHHMTKISSLCGHGTAPQEVSSPTSSRRLRLLFVSGPAEEMGEFRGFNFTISSSLAGSDSTVIVSSCLVSLLLVLAVLGGGLLCVRSSKRRRRRGRRRGLTWHGPPPRPGQSLHIDRTSSLRRELEGIPGSENIYSQEEVQEVRHQQPQYSLPARRWRRSLPSPPDSETPTVIVTTPTEAAKVYESLTSLTGSRPELPSRPPWSLTPEAGTLGSSPLYLVMSQTENSLQNVGSKSSIGVEDDVDHVKVLGKKGTEAIGDTQSQRRMSVTEASKQFIKRMSLGLASCSISAPFDQLIEEDYCEFENDDVFG